MAALLSESCIQEAARVAGISETTGYRWLKDADFKTAFKTLQDSITSDAVARIKGSMNIAVATLKYVMRDSEALPSARVSAARVILENSFKSIEIMDVLERLELLENKISDEEKGK
jgi:hypothetical protein